MLYIYSKKGADNTDVSLDLQDDLPFRLTKCQLRLSSPTRSHNEDSNICLNSKLLVEYEARELGLRSPAPVIDIRPDAPKRNQRNSQLIAIV